MVENGGEAMAGAEVVEEPHSSIEPATTQFTLRSMMASVTAIAVGLAICVQLGILGAVIVWIAAAAFTFITWRQRTPGAAGPRMLLWGIVMPVVCLAFDPGLIQQGLYAGVIDTSPLARPDWGLSEWHPWQLAIYAFLAFEMLCLTVWVLAGPSLLRGASFLGGVFWPGFLVATAAAIGYALPGFFLLSFAGVGLLGWTPVFTAMGFHRARLAAKEQSVNRVSKSTRRCWASLGVLATLLLPLLMALLPLYLALPSY